MQTQVLARWPDGSVKWLLCDALVGESTSNNSFAELRIDRESVAPVMSIVERATSIAVDTGTYQLLVDSAQNSSPATLRDMVSQRSVRLSVELSIDGTQSYVCWEAPVAATRGGVRTSLIMHGIVHGQPHLRVQLRLSCYAGTSLLRCEIALHNARAAQHQGGKWDLGDAGSQLFDDFSLRLTSDSTWSTASLKTEVGAQPTPIESPRRWSLVQYSSGGECWQSKNHVDRHGRVPLRVKGFQLNQQNETTSGLRCSPSLHLSAGGQSLMAAMPEFWQTFPKALSIDTNSMRYGLFPAEHGTPHELQGGERKRHTVWLSYSSDNANWLDWAHEPAVINASAQWHASSQAWPWFVDGNSELRAPAERVLSTAANGPESLLAKREAIDEYGWRNFGDVWADHEQDHYAGQGCVISHYNNQFDLLYGALAHGLRTGEQNWWRIADPLARHIVDIDIYHTTQDRAAFGGGLFWHTDHYISAGTATHRTYSRNNGGKDYGGGPSNEHNYATGLAHYYYLAGDPAARDAVISLADWVIASDDGRRSRWRLLDSGATGLASRTYEETYHGPGRGAGNSLQVLIDAWELSGQRHYLDFGEALIRRCIHPRDDIEARSLLSAEQRWSYTVFLIALDRYLTAKQSANEIDERYAYAQQSLLAYAEWMLGYERCYFDRREELEYITETWPAQDLRKANVMRLAASHADADTGARLREKADAITSKAYELLHSFSRFHSARAVSIVAMESLREAAARERLPQQPCQLPPLGDPVEFESSRARIKRRLKSPGGWLTLAANALRELCLR